MIPIRDRRSKYDHIMRDELKALYDAGKTNAQIAEHFGIPSVYQVAELLRKFKLTPYFTGQNKNRKNQNRGKNKPKPKTPVIQPPLISVSPEHEAFIRRNREKMPRREIARRLGIGKVELNQMILQLQEKMVHGKST